MDEKVLQSSLRVLSFDALMTSTIHSARSPWRVSLASLRAKQPTYSEIKRPGSARAEAWLPGPLPVNDDVSPADS